MPLLTKPGVSCELDEDDVEDDDDEEDEDEAEEVAEAEAAVVLLASPFCRSRSFSRGLRAPAALANAK